MRCTQKLIKNDKDLNNLTINSLHHLPTISITGHLHHQLHKNSQESLPSKLNIDPEPTQSSAPSSPSSPIGAVAFKGLQMLSTVPKEEEEMGESRSRSIWEEIVCSKNIGRNNELSGTDKIEGIALNYQAITDVKVSSQAFTGMKNLRFLKFQNANASHGPNSLPHDLRWLDWHGYPSKSLPGSFQVTKASSLHHLSGLSSLVELDLSDCSMLDGGIACDLGTLSSLVLLNLSNNKFGSIPAEAISRLPKLVELFLVGCENLEILPQLPSSLTTVCLDECTALEGSIDSLAKYKNLNKISITKCDQLLEDEDNSQIMIDSMWQHLLKGVSAEDDNFYICFPGTNIPEWFTYKNWGPSILVNLPQNWYNNKFLGFELCVVSEMIDTTKPLNHFNIGVRYGINAQCSLITPDGEKAFVGGGIGFMGIKQYMDSNITCLGYYSFEKWMLYLHINWVGSPNEWCQFEVSSEEDYSKNIVHKGFGVRLIYEEDDVKQSDEAEMSQSSSSQFNPEASQHS
nr:TMV resistance protein N-like [Ipomoea batatas]